MDPSIAYLSQGKLFVKLAGQEAREIESPFARQALERQARSQAQDGWKSRGGVWGSMGMAPPQLAQWEAAGAEGVRRCHIRSVTPAGEPGQVLYVVDLGNVGGLFQYAVASDNERRLMHRNDFPARDLARHPKHGTLAMSLRQPDGTACLAVSENEGRHISNITSGDSVDEAPAWVSDDRRRLVFQSAGIGRNQAGLALGLAPYTIELLDMDGEGIRTLLKDEASDLLAPRMSADGTLHFIRRPYKREGQGRIDPLLVLQDIVLFPYRLLRAIIYFLHFFSLFVSGQPLMTAGGPKRTTGDTRFLALWGHMIDTKRAMERAERDKPADLVPKEWELVRRDGEGVEKVLAQNVLSYDVAENGDLIYTNGSAVYRLDAEGERSRICVGAMIERVTALW